MGRAQILKMFNSVDIMFLNIFEYLKSKLMRKIINQFVYENNHCVWEKKWCLNENIHSLWFCWCFYFYLSTLNVSIMHKARGKEAFKKKRWATCNFVNFLTRARGEQLLDKVSCDNIFENEQIRKLAKNLPNMRKIFLLPFAFQNLG